MVHFMFLVTLLGVYDGIYVACDKLDKLLLWHLHQI